MLRAQGHLRAFMEDMRRARYPKKVRELKAWEDRAVEVLVYSNHDRLRRACRSPSRDDLC
ncbi:hypothetical protein ACE1SV_27080 [Streptomyces sp. E-15]